MPPVQQLAAAAGHMRGPEGEEGTYTKTLPVLVKETCTLFCVLLRTSQVLCEWTVSMPSTVNEGYIEADVLSLYHLRKQVSYRLDESVKRISDPQQETLTP